LANLQINGIDNELYEELKKQAAEENRSLSHQPLFLIKDYLAKRQHVPQLKTPAQTLLNLCGSWGEPQDTETITSKIKKGRKNSYKLKGGL
jgi:hypothetical protein